MTLNMIGIKLQKRHKT